MVKDQTCLQTSGPENDSYKRGWVDSSAPARPVLPRRGRCVTTGAPDTPCSDFFVSAQTSRRQEPHAHILSSDTLGNVFMDFLFMTLFWSLYFLASLSTFASFSTPGSLPVLRQGCVSPVSLSVTLHNLPFSGSPTAAPRCSNSCLNMSQWPLGHSGHFSKRSWVRQSRGLRSQKTSVC